MLQIGKTIRPNGGHEDARAQRHPRKKNQDSESNLSRAEIQTACTPEDLATTHHGSSAWMCHSHILLMSISTHSRQCRKGSLQCFQRSCCELTKRDFHCSLLTQSQGYPLLNHLPSLQNCSLRLFRSSTHNKMNIPSSKASSTNPL